MAMKQILNIEDKMMDKKYTIVGQSGVYVEEDYNKTNSYFLLNADKSNRFIMVDLWQIGIYGSENCNQTYDEEAELNIVTEKDVIKYTESIVKYINDRLFDAIKESIIDEIEADEQETIKLVR